MGTLLKIVVCVVAASARAPAGSQPTGAPSRPNIVVFLVDDLGMMDVGCYGNTFHETPAVDGLAARGVRFSQAYSASPVCSPTRAALLTGCDPVRVDITDWIKGWPIDVAKPRAEVLPPEDRDELPLDSVTLAEALRDRGYQTGFFGKWHLGGEGFLPTDQGFDINAGGHDKGSPPGGYYAPFNNPKLPDKPGDDYLTDRLTDEAVAFLENRDTARPALVLLSYYNVHTPIEANREYVGRYRDTMRAAGLTDDDPLINPAYASMVHAVDRSVARVLETLDAQGMTDSTIVLFTSDNGGLEPVRDQAPFRLGKAWLYEGGIRVPLIVAGPGVARGLESPTPAISMDIPVTLLALAAAEGDKVPASFADGVSLVPALRDEAMPERALHWHYPHYHRQGWRPGGAIRAGSFKLLEDFETGRFELYDLDADIGESNNLAAERPEHAARLLEALRSWREQMGARMPTPR